jgi:hypothetical protein
MAKDNNESDNHKMSRLNHLCTEYRMLDASDAKARRDKLGEMYLLCEELSRPIVINQKFHFKHLRDADSDRFDEVMG